MRPRLVPDDFNVPQSLETSKFRIRKLCARDVYLDYIAVMSSIDIIEQTLGEEGWPTRGLTLEEDLIDLAWHQREFEHRYSFAYTVMNLDETECLGCLYIFPPQKNTPQDSDVDVSFWVTQKAYEQGLYAELYRTIKDWLAKDWPFQKPFWANRVIPGEG